MNTKDEKALSNLYDQILNFKLTEIPSDIRFWMIRTKKGYFYEEFIQEKFVALAWNTITAHTNFSESEHRLLSDRIAYEYPEIKRPSLVISKCNKFIHEIKNGDILVIPSEHKKYVTFAFAGDYYEDNTKTYEIERDVISKIEYKEVFINEILCPYKKRRKIIPIRMLPIEAINYHLEKAISSYHGITNLDSYGTIILDHLYNAYTYKDITRLVFHVGKPNEITSKEFSDFLYGINSILYAPGIEENVISTQASVHSIGDIVFTLKDIYKTCVSNYMLFIALATIIGGGKFLTAKLPGIPAFIKDIMSIKDTKRKNDAEITKLELENMEKAIDLKLKLKENNLTIDDLSTPLELLASCQRSMQIEPIETVQIATPDTLPEDVQEGDEADLP